MIFRGTTSRHLLFVMNSTATKINRRFKIFSSCKIRCLNCNQQKNGISYLLFQVSFTNAQRSSSCSVFFFIDSRIYINFNYPLCYFFVVACNLFSTCVGFCDLFFVCYNLIKKTFF